MFKLIHFFLGPISKFYKKVDRPFSLDRNHKSDSYYFGNYDEKLNIYHISDRLRFAITRIDATNESNFIDIRTFNNFHNLCPSTLFPIDSKSWFEFYFL